MYFLWVTIFKRCCLRLRSLNIKCPHSKITTPVLLWYIEKAPVIFFFLFTSAGTSMYFRQNFVIQYVTNSYNLCNVCTLLRTAAWRPGDGIFKVMNVVSSFPQSPSTVSLMTPLQLLSVQQWDHVHYLWCLGPRRDPTSRATSYSSQRLWKVFDGLALYSQILLSLPLRDESWHSSHVVWHLLQVQQI